MTLNFDHQLEQGQAAAHEVADYLVSNFYDAIRLFALSMLGDGDEADEAAQQTMIRAASHIGQYEPHSNLKAWVYRIAHNICRDQLRKRKTRHRLVSLLTLGTRRDFAPSPELTAQQNERDRKLWQAVSTLADKHREPLILRYSHDLTTPEIAQILDLPPGTVRSRLHYAQRKLHGLLLAEGVTL